MSLDPKKLSRVDAAVTGLQKRMDAFEESKHPRAANGQFGSGGGGGGGKPSKAELQSRLAHVNRAPHMFANPDKERASLEKELSNHEESKSGGKMTLPQAPEGASKEEKLAHFDKLNSRLQSPSYSHHSEQTGRHNSEGSNHQAMREFHASRAEDPQHAEAMHRHEDAAKAHEAAFNAHRAGAQAVLNGEKSNRASADEHSKKARALGKLANAASRLTERKRTDEHVGFQKLENELSHEKGVTNPAGLAAEIGRKKYGAKGMAAKAAAGRKD